MKYGAPCRIRTCDLRLRRPTLYPAELRARKQRNHHNESVEKGKPDFITSYQETSPSNNEKALAKCALNRIG